MIKAFGMLYFAAMLADIVEYIECLMINSSNYDIVLLLVRSVFGE